MATCAPTIRSTVEAVGGNGAMQLEITPDAAAEIVRRGGVVAEGESQTAIQHLRTLAPNLSLEDAHFDITETGRADDDLPPLFLIALRDTAVGAVDFLPLPATRTLMRLFLCSDLDTVCALPDGDQIASRFATIWLERLRRLGFMSGLAPGATPRPQLGSRLPGAR